jgi:hypothetical protein
MRFHSARDLHSSETAGRMQDDIDRHPADGETPIVVALIDIKVIGKCRRINAMATLSV